MHILLISPGFEPIAHIAKPVKKKGTNSLYRSECQLKRFRTVNQAHTYTCIQLLSFS